MKALQDILATKSAPAPVMPTPQPPQDTVSPILAEKPKTKLGQLNIETIIAIQGLYAQEQAQGGQMLQNSANGSALSLQPGWGGKNR